MKYIKKLNIKLIFLSLFFINKFSLAQSQNKPNVILIFPDNIGMGEVNSFGGSRAVPTPNIDKIGKEGMKLTNFNVEYSCTPSRISILTGRYAARAGDDYYSGTTLWENTIAEHLKSAGYATALYGKWDLGGENWHGKREPTDQGFDEWYGIPGTSHYSQFTSMKGFPKSEEIPYIWEGVAGSPSKKVKPFDLETRRTIDREAAQKGVNFIRKNTEKKKPFFLYYPMTQLHFPALPHPDKLNTTGAGDMGDSMADVDFNVGLILKELERLGIEKNTLVIWCSDNGAEMRRPWRGTSGPWRGFYNSAMEGGVRTPCVLRMPGRIKAGQMSNEIVHEVDLFTTITSLAGISKSALENNRIIDGIDQMPFFEGNQAKSNRESAIFMNRNGDVMAVKWRDWKFWYNFKTELPDTDPENVVRLFDLRVDPQEEIDVKDYYPGIIGVMDSIVKVYELSLVARPRVSAEANLADPYLPPPMGSGKLLPTYTRSDRTSLKKKTNALPNPDFTGSWSTVELNTVSVINRTDKQKMPKLGSGFGEKITIIQRPNSLEIEKVHFTPRELQPMINYHFNLDGTSAENTINMGRGSKPIVSNANWQDNRLVITTLYPFPEHNNSPRVSCKVIQTLWLEEATNAPWEPSLIIETYREGILGGISSTNRTIYNKGYR
jgi:arylsulfatase A-like enzyme